MYCVYDKSKKIIAFHDELDVVEVYKNNVSVSHPELPELYIGKIKKKKLNKIIDIDSLYLVRYCDTYVQSGYLVYLELVSDQYIYDNKYCKDVLLRILECTDITDKERKSIERTVKVVDRILQEAKEYTPTITELQGYEVDYYPYMYNRGVF